MNSEQLAKVYLQVKGQVLEAGYSWEIDMVKERTFDDVKTAEIFLLEHAYVVLCSGFRNATVEGFWDRYVAAWERWTTWETIDVHQAEKDAREVFGHELKNRAVGTAIVIMRRRGWDNVRAHLISRPIEELSEWPFMGPIVRYHLARNLGLDFVKPDRHLERIAKKLGAETPRAMCDAIAEETGDRLGVIDVVLWRFAERNPGYLDLLGGMS